MIPANLAGKLPMTAPPVLGERCESSDATQRLTPTRSPARQCAGSRNHHAMTGKWMSMLLLTAMMLRGGLAAEQTPTFELDRDPFQPIGYTYTPPEAGDHTISPAAPTRQATPEWPELRLKGIVRSGATLTAVIEPGGVVTVGDLVEKRIGNHVFQWLIKDITDNSVVPERLGVRQVPGR